MKAPLLCFPGDAPYVTTMFGEVQYCLFELPDEEGELAMLAWFRKSRARWRSVDSAQDRRRRFFAVAGGEGAAP